jgi:hypothetical protein
MSQWRISPTYRGRSICPKIRASKSFHWTWFYLRPIVEDLTDVAFGNLVNSPRKSPLCQQCVSRWVPLSGHPRIHFIQLYQIIEQSKPSFQLGRSAIGDENAKLLIRLQRELSPKVWSIAGSRETGPVTIYLAHHIPAYWFSSPVRKSWPNYRRARTVPDQKVRQHQSILISFHYALANRDRPQETPTIRQTFICRSEKLTINMEHR